MDAHVRRNHKFDSRRHLAQRRLLPVTYGGHRKMGHVKVVGRNGIPKPCGRWLPDSYPPQGVRGHLPTPGTGMQRGGNSYMILALPRGTQRIVIDITSTGEDGKAR